MNVIYRRINEQEVKDIKTASATFAQRFVAKRLELLPGGRGLSDLRGRFTDAADRADVDGRRRAAHRVRQRRQPDAGPHGGAAQGDRAAAGARVRARADHPAAVRGEPAARRGRGGGRRAARLVDRVAAAGRAPGRSCSADAVSHTGPARAGLHAGAGAAYRARVRPRACDPRFACVRQRDAQGGGRQRDGRRPAGEGPPRAGRRAGGAVDGAPRRRRPVRPQPAQPDRPSIRGSRSTASSRSRSTPRSAATRQPRTTALFKELQDALGAVPGVRTRVDGRTRDADRQRLVDRP